MKNAFLVLVVSWVAWGQPAVEAAQQLPPRTRADGPAPRITGAWSDARVGDQATWRFKFRDVTGKLRAEVLTVGPTVTVSYEVTSEALGGPLAFRVGVDRVRAVPHAVEREEPSIQPGSFTIGEKVFPCEQVAAPDTGRISQGTGCRALGMPYALLDGWLEVRGGEFELALEEATRGVRGAKPSPTDSPMVLAPFAWAYQKERPAPGAEVGSYRQYSIRGFVLDAYLRFPMTCNVGLCAYVQARPLGEFVASLIVDVWIERTRKPRPDMTVTDELVTVNGRQLEVRTSSGLRSVGDVLRPGVDTSVRDPFAPGLDGLMWSHRVPWIFSGSPEAPRWAELLSWGTGTPAPLPLVPMMERRGR